MLVLHWKARQLKCIWRTWSYDFFSCWRRSAQEQWMRLFWDQSGWRRGKMAAWYCSFKVFFFHHFCSSSFFSLLASRLLALFCRQIFRGSASWEGIERKHGPQIRPRNLESWRCMERHWRQWSKGCKGDWS